MTVRIKLMDAGYVTRVPGGTLHYPTAPDCEPAGWTTRLVLDPLGPVPVSITEDYLRAMREMQRLPHESEARDQATRRFRRVADAYKRRHFCRVCDSDWCACVPAAGGAL